MNIADCILYLHPDAKPFEDFVVTEEHGEQAITVWNLPEPQPTVAELEAVWPAAERAAQVRLIRIERDRLLAETDYLMLVDRYEALSQGEKDDLKVYRQALRDLPETIADPANPVYPTKPGWL